MNLTDARRLWQQKMLANYEARMSASHYTIERVSVRRSFEYCVSHYVAGRKVAEYWPDVCRGISLSSTGAGSGKPFLATESIHGDPL